MKIAGIDQGTTSTRALLVDSDGRIEVVHSVEHHQLYPREGWVEHDPEELIANIQACVAAAGKVDAFGIDNQGESCLAWDARTKEALSPVIVWQDNRTLAEIERLREEGREPEVLARAGLPLDPYFSASKMAWIVRNIPEAAAALSRGSLRLGTTDAFFLDRLTGRFVTDVSTASRTSLMNLETQCWDETLCALFGVPVETLPDIVPTTGDFGALDTEYGPIPVTTSVVDQQAALYGFGCRQKGDAKITFGTGAFALMVTGAEIVRDPEAGLLPTVAWQKSGEAPVFAVDGGVYTASAALNWAKGLGLFKDLSEINSFYTPSAIGTGLAFVPALAGLGCPYWDPRARGAWVGLSLDHKPLQLVQSILEGVAFRAAEVIEAMNACVPVREALSIDGGMSKNPYFVQFLANVTGREIRPAIMPELTGLGTVQLAADYLGFKPATVSQFSECKPAADGRGDLRRFKEIVELSRALGKQ
ncbi:FGGY family carbohydrate kinase [Sneathiella chinensis]|uniref:ATP:glycerol 3-phosphotransferase n=1 Tax=Sneathiella chinensis TaxID=349750 RepID=A0ABQ5U2I1_9PROT|nr:FGGY family carbohydrate kinase [Sneathiella chinensis]GLQ05395.1 carbohydrate kinase [Sneathiella chinensis]